MYVNSAGIEDHPRIRGEHFALLPVADLWGGSSPHTRGAHAVGGEGVWGDGIIPAYAGSTASVSSMGGFLSDHPRIRGEHDGRSVLAGSQGGSSPHTRGARRGGEPVVRAGRIIPAYAGSTSPARATTPSTPDHPRIRGEHVRSRSRGGAVEGSSPHTRGAPSPPSAASSAGSDHPRIRGEHIVGSIGMVIGWGSSPHTRGAHAVWAGDFADSGIIPAYAGSTLYRYGPYRGT